MATVFAVLMPGGENPTIAGLPARERNRRILRRAGLVAVGDVPLSSDPVLVVQHSTLLTPAILEHLPPPDGPHMLVGDCGQPVAVWGPGVLLSGLEGFETTRFGEARVVLPCGVAFDVSTRVGARKAGRALLKASGKETDGWVARNLNRPVSRAISTVFLRLGFTANQASALSLLLALSAAWFAAQTSWTSLVAAAALFHLASVIDGVDGEIARLTYTESPWGSRLDSLVDKSSHLICLVAFGVGWVRTGLDTAGLVLLGCVALLLVAALAQGAQFMRRYAPDPSWWIFIDRCVDRAARQSGAPAFRMVRFVFALMRRDAFALIFLVLSFAGTRTIYFFALGFGAVVSLATFSLRGDRLVAAALVERRAMEAAAAPGPEQRVQDGAHRPAWNRAGALEASGSPE
jgi:phosphatidylglycerophosphate synthase